MKVNIHIAFFITLSEFLFSLSLKTLGTTRYESISFKCLQTRLCPYT